MGVGGGTGLGPAQWELSPICKVRLALRDASPTATRPCPPLTSGLRSQLPGLTHPPHPPLFLFLSAQLPREQPGPPPPPPGCAPGSSAALGSGPGVVPGSEGGEQKLGSVGLRRWAFRDPQVSTSGSVVLQAGVGRALWKGVA